MALCIKCGAEELLLSDGLCPSCTRVFGDAQVRRRRQFDLAYGAYAVLGLFCVFMIAWLLGLIDFGLGLVLVIAGFPLLFVIPALVIAIALSLKHRQHRPFRFLGAMTGLALFLPFVIVPLENLVVTVLVFSLYGFAVLWFAGTWLRRLRHTFFLESDAADSPVVGRLFQ